MIDIKIGRALIGFAAWEHTELYKCEIENISSNIFLSDLSRALRNTFHPPSSSSTLANLNEGIVLPIQLNHSLFTELFHTSCNFNEESR